MFKFQFDLSVYKLSCSFGLNFFSFKEIDFSMSKNQHRKWINSELGPIKFKLQYDYDISN